MNVEKNVVKVLEGKGRMRLVELASLFLPSPPIRVWEEEFDGEECDEDCEECDLDDEGNGHIVHLGMPSMYSL